MKTCKLILIYGPPCSGKTTLGTKLSSIHKIEFISTDLIRKEMFGDKIKFTTDENIVVFDALIERLKLAILMDKCMICEGLFNSKIRREAILNIMPDRITVIYLTAKYETLKRRLFEERLESNYTHIKHVLDINLNEQELHDFYVRSIPPNYDDIIIHTDDLEIGELLNKGQAILNNIEFDRQTFKEIFLYD